MSVFPLMGFKVRAFLHLPNKRPLRGIVYLKFACYLKFNSFLLYICQSKIIKCQKCTEKSIKFSNFPYYNEIVIAEPGNVYTFDLKNKSEMIEIIVPTCSYRNGEAKTGFGAAVIGM